MDFLKEECCICLEKNMARDGRPGQLNCRRLTCCGCCFCISCLDEFDNQQEKTGLPWDCPLCRAPQAFGKEEFNRGMKKAKEGKGWAQEWIGQMYYIGEGVPKSFTKAFEFLSLAAALGQPNAQNTLGTMYMNGQGVRQSSDLGFQFYEQAADQGLPNAIGSLGLCYKLGNGVEKSLEKAFELFLLAVDGENLPSHFLLGNCYFKGEGIEKDYEKAIHFFTLASDNGFKLSQFKIAECYRKGEGVKQSLVKSIYWLKQCLKDNPDKELCAFAQRILDALLLLSSEGCAQCGNREGRFTIKCSRCLSVCYCNSVCQTKHWKEGGHKAECNIYKKA